MKNIAYIDGQNLHLGTTSDGWVADIVKLRTYLRDKYNIEKAYYFLGYVQDANHSLYMKLQEAGFIVVFKKQIIEMKSHKKGNVDSDMIFHMMVKLLDESASFNQILLISGDGDFHIITEYLIKKDRLCKILFPNRKFASSLYKGLDNRYRDYLINNKSKLSR